MRRTLPHGTRTEPGPDLVDRALQRSLATARPAPGPAGRGLPARRPVARPPSGKRVPWSPVVGAGRTSCWPETPSRRTPGATSSAWSSSPATRRRSAARSVGSARVRERVTVVKSPKRTLSWTVRAVTPADRRRDATPSASPTRRWSRAAWSWRSTGNVSSCPIDFTSWSATTARSSRFHASVVEVVAGGAPERQHQGLLGKRGELAHGGDAELGELALGGRPHAPEPADAERVQQVELGARLHHEEAVGLAEVAGQLGQHLGGGHAHRRVEPGVGLHPRRGPRPRSRVRCRGAGARPPRRGTPRRARSARPAA